MVAASLISACCGVILTFSIPKFLSVDDFGVWRTFILYGGYAGLLHLGLVDGALLRWSGKSPHRGALSGRDAQGNRVSGDRIDPVDRIGPVPRKQLTSALRFLAIQHLALVGLAVIALWLIHPGFAPRLFIALAGYAALFNLVGLVQVYLQTGLRFAPVAFGMSGPTALFVVALGGLALSHVSVSRLLAGFLFAWAVTLAVLLWVAYRPQFGQPAEANGERRPLRSIWRFGLDCVAVGWPIVLANTGYGLMQSADRVTVNLTRPLHDFAIYSLSQSTIYVPITILAAVSRVAFSWFARARQDAGEAGQARPGTSIYASSTRLLTLLWSLLLPYYFAVEWVVRRFLPRYIDGLPAGRILLLSVIFLGLVGIIQLNTWSLEGRQRQFFLGSLLAVAVAFATAWFGSVRLGSLTAVAWSQVLSATLWWLGNEWFLRDRKLLPMRDILTVLATFTVSYAGLSLASLGSLSAVSRAAVYYILCAIPLASLYPGEFRAGWYALRQFQIPFQKKS